MPNSSKSSKNSKKDEEENESELSPPSYSVVEDSNGSLVNLELQVKWPQRPKNGPYSKEEYLKRKSGKRLQQQQQKQRRHEKMKHKESKTPAKSPDPESLLNLSDSDKFVGCHSSCHVTEFLRPTEFVLYYRRPDAIATFDEMPICMPLSIAYMTSKNKIYHFGIDTFKDESGTLWTVVLGNGIEQPYFRTMKGLIDFYTSFGYLRKDGSIELFNVPEN